MKSLMLLALGASLLSMPAAAADEDACSDSMDISWETNVGQATVETVVLDVPGCDDGEPVGVQLITDDGDVPRDGPIMAEVQDEQADIDITALEQRIEPVTGVRVFLELSEDEVRFLEITVDRRFFNAPGNEQKGLRQTTVLQVEAGEDYVIPGAPQGYGEIDCADVDLRPDDIIDEGSGTATAAEAGRHLVCYQQDPGGPRGPIDDEPEVVGDDENGDDTDVLGEGQTRDEPDEPDEPDETANGDRERGDDGDRDGAGDGEGDDKDRDDTEVLGTVDDAGGSGAAAGGLAMTGVNFWLAVVAGSLLVAAGAWLTRAGRVTSWRRSPGRG